MKINMKHPIYLHSCGILFYWFFFGTVSNFTHFLLSFFPQLDGGNAREIQSERSLGIWISCHCYEWWVMGFFLYNNIICLSTFHSLPNLFQFKLILLNQSSNQFLSEEGCSIFYNWPILSTHDSVYSPDSRI